MYEPVSGSCEQAVHLLLLNINAKHFLSCHSFLTSALLSLHPRLDIWPTSQCLLLYSCFLQPVAFTGTSGSTSIFYTSIFLFSVICVVSVGRWEVETFHVEIRSSFSSSNEAIFSMVTPSQDPNTCFICICSQGIKLFSQVSESALGKEWKNSNEGRNQSNLPQTPSRIPLFTQHLQSLPSGGTADLGWILTAEEFCFANYSEECDSLVKLHNHSPSQSGCGHQCLHPDHEATFILQLSRFSREIK